MRTRKTTMRTILLMTPMTLAPTKMVTSQLRLPLRSARQNLQKRHLPRRHVLRRRVAKQPLSLPAI
jgi:hypothetical protein